MKLDPFRVVVAKSKKIFKTSQYWKLDNWNKKHLYPNPRSYRGSFLHHKDKNRGRPQGMFEEIYDKIKLAQDAKVTNPSPVHLVWLRQTLQCRPWYEKVIARRLGLHSRLMYERVLVPNTPHYNQLLYEIKHLIVMKPLTFPDGLPTEADIGATKFCAHTGTVRKGDQYKVPPQRLVTEVPDILEPHNNRQYLRNLIGLWKKS